MYGNQIETFIVYSAEVLVKQNATTEEKKILALIKAALCGDNLITFINEISKVFNGNGKVKVDTVKRIDRVF